MNARFATAATIFTAFAGALAARAADAQLLSYAMPDAKVLAGVNVDQAKASPFGQYVLTQMQSNNTALEQLIALTGFDPTRDVHEILAATNSPGSSGKTGLVLARGNFQPATITAAATGKGAVTELYGGVTIIEDPKKAAGIAFPDPTIVMAGDLASVKAAIDRPASGQALPTAVVSQVNQWSGSEDAWVVMTVPPASLAPASATATAGNNPLGGIVQQIQQLAGGVKFGDMVVGTAAIQSDNAADATQLASALQFLVNVAQMQSQNNQQLASVAQGLTIAAQGSTVKVTVSLPQAQFQSFFQQEKRMVVGGPHAVPKR